MLDRMNKSEMVKIGLFHREVSLRAINRWVTGATVGVAIVYAILFFSRIVWGGVNGVTGVFPGNPRLVIFLFLTTAALTSLYFGEIGKILSAAFFGGLVLFFYYWWSFTSGIKENLGVETLRGDWLQNWLIGASWLDVPFFFAALVLLGLDIWTVGKKLRSRKKNAPPLSSPANRAKIAA